MSTLRNKRVIILILVLLLVLIGVYMILSAPMSYNKAPQGEELTPPKPAPVTAPRPTSAQPNAIAPPPTSRQVIKPPTKQSVNKGNILYNPPTDMVVGVIETVHVKISKDDIDPDSLLGSGDVREREISVTKTMSASLCCDGSFKIESNSSEKQRVDNEGVTEWLFRVTAREQGSHDLLLNVKTVSVDSAGKESVKDLIFSEVINVQVDTAMTAKKWLINNWHWLGLILIIPLAALFINRRNKEKPSFSGNESVFISYRRDDSSGHTLALYEKLKTTLGDEQVFMDVDDIPHGKNFAQHIQEVLSKADTMLVMIGQNWVNASNSEGRRLDNPGDFVRMEVATALSENLHVIPVLLRGAQMPAPQDLPEDLRKLCMRNAISIYDDQFNASVDRLIQSLSD